MNGFRFLSVVLLSIPLLACSGKGDSPEEQIRSLLSAGENAVESRSISGVQPLLLDRYRDEDGRDKRAVLRLLGGYFISHQSIYLLTQVGQIKLTGQDQAKATLFVAVAGQPVTSPTQFSSLHVDLLRFDLELVDESGEWRISHSRWRRAGRQDFFE